MVNFICEQVEFTLQGVRRGVYDVTGQISGQLRHVLANVEVGTLHLFLKHTSAALTINENCCREVKTDLVTYINTLAPFRPDLKHVLEGEDDMPAHLVSSLFGCEITVPVRNGKIAMGTWQGIDLIEWRYGASARTITATIMGKGK